MLSDLRGQSEGSNSRKGGSRSTRVTRQGYRGLAPTGATGVTLAAPAKLYRIGELVRYTPFSRQTIHNYTIMGLIQESEWTDGGHRLYDESVFARLSRIIEMRKSKTLWQVSQILRKEAAVGAVRE